MSEQEIRKEAQQLWMEAFTRAVALPELERLKAEVVQGVVKLIDNYEVTMTTAKERIAGLEETVDGLRYSLRRLHEERSMNERDGS